MADAPTCESHNLMYVPELEEHVIYAGWFNFVGCKSQHGDGAIFSPAY